MVRRLSPQSPGRRALITYSVQCIVLLCVCLVPRPYIIFREFLCHDVAFCAESAVNQPTHTQTRTEKHALRITITLEHRAVLKWFLPLQVPRWQHQLDSSQVGQNALALCWYSRIMVDIGKQQYKRKKRYLIVFK